MTTQSLRGMANHGPMHWRGDRTGGNDGARSVQPDSGAFDEQRGVQEVQRRPSPACSGAARSSADDGDAGVHRLHPAGDLSAQPDPATSTTRSPPTSRPGATSTSITRPTDRRSRPTPSTTATAATSLDPAGQRPVRRGQARLLRHRRPLLVRGASRSSSRSRTCATCTRRSACSGWAGLSIPSDTSAPSAVPAAALQRRIVPWAIRCAGSASCTTAASTRCSASTAPPSSPSADATARSQPGRHPRDGRPDDPATAQPMLANIQPRRQHRGLHAGLRLQPGPDCRPAGDADRRAGPDVEARIDLLEARAAAGECDLVVNGRPRAAPATSLIRRRARFIPDRARRRPATDRRALARAGALTFTAVPPGYGRRIGLDRDLDGVLDGDDEIAAGSPRSEPGADPGAPPDTLAPCSRCAGRGARPTRRWWRPCAPRGSSSRPPASPGRSSPR